MATYKELCNGKPSVALQAMYDGIKRQEERDDFVINMSVYYLSNKEKEVCYGCAATCTLQELTGKTLTYKDTNNDWPTHKLMNKGNPKDESYFEDIINLARIGVYSGLFEYFGIEYKYDISDKLGSYDLEVRNSNYLTEIEKLPKIISYLESIGY